MKIKVCGLKEPENIRQVAALAPDLMGFIFYQSSPRYAGNLSPEVLAGIEGEKVGVFVNEQPGIVIRTARKYHFDNIQLHGQESPEYCRQLQEAGFKVWKAMGIAGKEDLLLCREFEGVCDGFVFDTRCAQYGGSGKTFDWKLLEVYTGNVPFLLSGGIAPGHAGLLKNMRCPAMLGVDVNSRFESAPGVKHIPALEVFIKSLR